MSRARLSGINVIVASEERELQTLYRDVLASAGASVTLADSVQDALALAAQLRPDVAIAALKGRGAVELLFRMRAVAGLSEVPVIAVVAHGEAITVKDGFDDVVEQPVDPVDLLARVIGRVRSRRGISGGSDLPIRARTKSEQTQAVKDVLASAALCWRCIAEKVGLTPQALNDVMIGLRAGTGPTLQLGSCDGCRKDVLLYRIIKVPPS